MKHKPRILICTDSAALDTGFGRVAREIGKYLHGTGDYLVAQHGWFHPHDTDRIVPFQIFGVAPGDGYGRQSYDGIVAKFRPDLVLTIGDHWMVKHLATRPRPYKLVGYFPIDSIPISPDVAMIFAAFDHAVFYGEFGLTAVLKTLPEMGPMCDVIPHGVDTEMFRPLGPEARAAARKMLSIGKDVKFLLGCVARNNSRKQIPRLLKAYAKFILPWTSCLACGAIFRSVETHCNACASPKVKTAPAKDDVLLYLHSTHIDKHGHDLHDLIRRFGLVNRVVMPQMMRVGHGCTDARLAEIYNAFDLFTLPTGGEGWGLPILEAMSCGVPVLVTDYSAHLEFCAGASELISVSDFDTRPEGNTEWAMVDLADYELKLDRFYYGHEQFWNKWGVDILGRIDAENQEGALKQFEKFSYGEKMRRELGELGRKKALSYRWSDILPQWSLLINRALKHNPSDVQVESAVRYIEV